MDQTNFELWKYRLEDLEGQVCELAKVQKQNSEKINEHDKLIDRVGLKLDQIGNNVIEVKATLTKMTDKKEAELEKEAGRPITLKWAIVQAVAIIIVTALITRSLSL